MMSSVFAASGAPHVHDARRVRDPCVGELEGEQRRGGGGDDSARADGGDERAFVSRELRPRRREKNRERSNDDHRQDDDGEATQPQRDEVMQVQQRGEDDVHHAQHYRRDVTAEPRDFVIEGDVDAAQNESSDRHGHDARFRRERVRDGERNQRRADDGDPRVLRRATQVSEYVPSDQRRYDSDEDAGTDSRHEVEGDIDPDSPPEGVDAQHRDAENDRSQHGGGHVVDDALRLQQGLYPLPYLYLVQHWRDDSRAGRHEECRDEKREVPLNREEEVNESPEGDERQACADRHEPKRRFRRIAHLRRGEREGPFEDDDCDCQSDEGRKRVVEQRGVDEADTLRAKQDAETQQEHHVRNPKSVGEKLRHGSERDYRRRYEEEI
jgi:hypothetical protein